MRTVTQPFGSPLRTTLTLDDDVLAVARAMAHRQGTNLGEVISALARRSLTRDDYGGRMRNGIPLLSAEGGTVAVTPEIVRALQDELA